MFESLFEIIINSPIGEIILLYAIIFIPFVIWDKKKREVKNKQKEILVTKIVESFNKDSIKSIQDLENLYLGVLEYNKFELDEIAKILQKVSVKFYSEDKEKSEHIINKINQFLNEIKKKEPFSELPYTEKSALNNLLLFKNKLNDGEDIFVSKLHDLSHVIMLKYNENSDLLKKNNKHTKLSYSVGIIGIVVSIFFALNSNSNNNEEIVIEKEQQTFNKILEKNKIP